MKRVDKRSVERISPVDRLFLNYWFAVWLITPLFLFFWPTWEGPYTPGLLFFSLLILFAAFTAVTYLYLKRNIPEQVGVFLKKRFGFLLIYFSLMAVLLMGEFSIRLTGLAEWGGGQGPLQRDFGLKKYNVNAEGFRGKYVPVERIGKTFRIMGLGDSFGFGQGVGEEEVYLEQLKKMLRQKMPEKRIEVINRSKPGWNTIKEYQYCSSKGYLYKPDVLVILYCLNDPEFGGYFLKPLISITWLEKFLERSHLYFYMMKVYNGRVNPYHSYIHGLYQDGSQTVRVSMEALGRIGDICRKDGIKPVLAICPLLDDIENYSFQKEHDFVRAWGESAGFQVLDLLSSFRNSGYKTEALRVSRQNTHPNAQGHRIIAESLSKLF